MNNQQVIFESINKRSRKLHTQVDWPLIKMTYPENPQDPLRIFAWCTPSREKEEDYKDLKEEAPFETVSNVSKYDGLDELVTRREGLKHGRLPGQPKKTKCDLNGLIAWAQGKREKRFNLNKTHKGGGRRGRRMLSAILFWPLFFLSLEAIWPLGNRRRRRDSTGRPAGQDPSMDEGIQPVSLRERQEVFFFSPLFLMTTKKLFSKTISAHKKKFN